MQFLSTGNISNRSAIFCIHQVNQIVMARSKLPSDLAKCQVLLAVRLITSAPTISLSAPANEPFQLIVGTRIISSTDPGRPVTMVTYGSIFKYTSEGEGLDALATSAFSNLVNSYDNNRQIRLGQFYACPSSLLPFTVKNSCFINEKLTNFILDPEIGKDYNSPTWAKGRSLHYCSRGWK